MYRILLLLLVGISSLQAQEPTAPSFKGKVKSVSEHSFATKKRHGEVVKGRPSHEYSSQRDFLIQYDSSGKISREFLYNKRGILERSTEFIYDDHGFITKRCSKDHTGKPDDSTTFSNEYFPDGKIRSRIVDYPGPITMEFFYKHDSLGSIYEYRRFDQSVPLKTQESATYDRNWLLMKNWIYDAKGKPILYLTYEYDSLDRLITKKLFNSANELNLQYKWKYDEQGVITRYESCSAFGLNCEAWTYKYEYDKIGNWIKRIDYRNGKPVYVKEREITYY